MTNMLSREITINRTFTGGELRFNVFFRTGNYNYKPKTIRHIVLKRKIMNRLLEWKSQAKHKCLIVRGQRQVGKTYIIEQFGKTYPHFIEINFVKNPSLKQIFEGDLDTKNIISKMKLYFDPELFVPGSTLIFIDEIQECKAARSSLKFFTENGEYDVVCSGSNIGIDEMCDEKLGYFSAPVGYESSMTMFGLDFEEFLWSAKVPEEAISEVKGLIRTHSEIPSAYLSVFESHFRDFMTIGGMPEAVQRFVDTRDYTEARKPILELVSSAKADMTKYNIGVDRLKTVECYDSIPYQLDQTNKKFMYSRVNGEGSRKSAEKYMRNLLWIKAAGYGNFCYSLYSLDKPLGRMKNQSSFRIYLSDTGILTNLYGMNTVRAVQSSDYSYNLGAIAENSVCECLVKSGYEPYYYSKSSEKNRMEIDFIVEADDKIIAIEVKSGKSRSAPSINKLDDSVVTDKVMLRTGNCRCESGDIKGYPLFAAAFFDCISHSDSE